MKKIVSIFFLLSLVITSCDKVDDPFPKDLGNSISLDGNTEYITEPGLNINSADQLLELLNSNTWDSLDGYDNSNKRFIVLEEFTGHKCIFCPLGTREIIRLDGIHGDQLIPVAIHAGDFAKPEASGSKYTTDLRPTGNHGEVYLNTFNPGNAYPRGMVSRLGAISKSANSWEPDINSIKDDQSAAVIKLRNYYAAASNLLRIDAEIEWLQTLPENYHLQVMVLEDHIIDWQKDGSQEVSNYDHRHVLRKVVNDTFGKALKAATQGEKEKIQYILTLDPTWKAGDMESVVYIFNNDPNSYEVIQANAAHVAE